ncbi:SDR family NAD(P)-dependent oxidoreductase [Saccharopolyspora sp. 6T]|uniref:type I polyketide synthase n=1 Tax=Saccharopolyspora sp. 6T TaxID=2877238 RepID=UPI001CD74195|nr:type I polyketide synthase [Saccharopolyspora sp. 6T]MCA1188437.1 SDR family NAD(P)-dependent oxidoreductase [Saccharopolyspora sp. 6T]
MDQTFATPLLFTGADLDSVRDRAARIGACLRDPELEPHDVAAALASAPAGPARAALVAATRAEAVRGLAALGEGRPFPGLSTGVVRPSPVAFLFTGIGVEWAGMAAPLIAAHPEFAAVVDQVDAVVAPALGRSLRAVLEGGSDEAELLRRIDWAQIALFTVQVGLCAVLRERGLEPAYVLGHSAGEPAAAHVAGVLDLDDAARLLVARARLMRTLQGGGAMVSLQAGAEEVAAELGELADEVSIAVVNGPRATVISGAADPVLEVAARFEELGRGVKWLDVDVAVHSNRVDPILAELADDVRDLTFTTPRVPVVSAVAGAADDAVATPGYWVRSLREPVRFADGIGWLHERGVRTFVEIGPDAVLSSMLAGCVPAHDDVAAVPLLRKRRPVADSLAAAAAQLHVRGVDLAPLAAPPAPSGHALRCARFWLDGGPLPEGHAEAEPGPAGAADLAELVRAHAAGVLGKATPEEVDATTSFFEQGFDSAAAVEFCALLNRDAGLDLPVAALFDHSTPAALVDHVAGLRDGVPAVTGARTADRTDADDEPIAIVGMGCRLPGGIASPEQFWEALLAERDVVSSFPTDRGWTEDLYDPDPDRGGRTYASAGGFLHDAALFDAEFFGISEYEAQAMDPQQRLLLEVCWEAVERAGIVPESLRGSRTGVYLGATAQPYGPALDESAGALDGFVLTGTTPSVLSGRVAYQFGFHGPALTVDTACSASLVALHLAVQSLRRGECSMAMAGGAAVLATPGMLVTFARQRGLAPDGRCKAFAADADGTGWGEGAGVLLLERLSDARRNGHPVLALVRGSAVNSDGTSNGLTAPNGLAQQEVIRSALAGAGLSASEVDAVEAHGTGTRLGDPVEARALLATYGADRAPERPLRLGSVKSNVGHTQTAAGVTGLIKMVLALQHEVLPRTLHVDAPSPHVDWDADRIALLTERTPWPRGTSPRRAGLSAFGISGTNAHVIIEEAPPVEAGPEPDDDGVVALPLSAKTAPALAEQARRFAAHLAAADRPALRQWSRAMARRSSFPWRAVAVGGSAAELVTGLTALAEQRPAPGAWSGRALDGRTAVLFSGQGSQRVGMGRLLHAEHPVFAAAFDEVCALFDAETGGDLRAVIADDERALTRTGWAQPALFAIEVALFRLLESWGLRPDVVLGHSLGELVAAHVAGILDLPDAVRVVAARARLMEAVDVDGTMTALEATEDEVRAVLAEHPDGIAVAAVNAPRSTVVSGRRELVESVAGRFSAQGRQVWPLRVSHPFHTPLMAGMLDEFGAVLRTATFRRPNLPVVSNVTGELADERMSAPDYWLEHVLGAVRFADGVRTAREFGARTFVEVGPGAALTVQARACLAELDPAAVVAATLRQGRDETTALLHGVAQLHVAGQPVDWDAVAGPGGGTALPQLPTYAFQRKHFWLTSSGRSTGVTEFPPAPSVPAIDGLTGEQRRARLLELVLEQTAACLGTSERDQVEPGLTFAETGLGSVGLLELRNRLVAATGLELPAAAAYDHPTPRALAEQLGRLDPAVRQRAEPVARTEVVEPRPADDGPEPIAIIGMACRFPGGVTTPGELWDLVAEGRDVVSEFPTDRGWPTGLHSPDPDRPGKTYCTRGGFLRDPAMFDSDFFGIAPREALVTDAQQRLLLETSWEAFERAGIDPISLRGSDTGVFVGITYQDYTPRWVDRPRAVRDHEGYLQSGTASSIATGRLSYFFGFEGPSIGIDTACSSSLVSLHLGVEALRGGQCGYALAGGATVMPTPQPFVEFSRLRALSPDGRCKSFSADADGTGWGEGAGVLLLERLSDAQRNGHKVHAVVLGTAVGADGASNGLTAPNGLAQQRTIRTALRTAGISGRDVDVVEAHGTGTKLGDPIEAQALVETYGRDRAPDRPLFVGSIKSNIGHPQTAAGVAGVIKLVESFRHGVLPKTLHADEPTPLIDWPSSGLSLLAEQRSWPATDGPRRAAISGFGIGGTLGHAILQEPPAPQRPRPAPAGRPVAWVLSGQTAAALQDQARHLLEHPELDAHRVADVAHTLARRTAFRWRGVVVGSSVEQLREGLELLARGCTGNGVWSGQGRDAPATTASGPLEDLAQRHVDGAPVDWTAVFPTGEFLDELPTYAFQRQRYWLELDAGEPSTGHPFLDEPIDLADGSGAVVNGRVSVAAEAWLADHVLRGDTIFPGTGHVELALRAGRELGCPRLVELTHHSPLLLPDDGYRRIQVSVGAPGAGRRRPLKIHSAAAGGSEWTLHASGELGPDAEPVEVPSVQWPPPGAEAVDVAAMYEGFTEREYEYGPAFRGVRAAWRTGDEVTAEVALPADVARDAGELVLHPALLDACLHAMGVLDDGDDVRVPFAWSGVTAADGPPAGEVRVRLTKVRPDTATLVVEDLSGRLVLAVDALTFRSLQTDPGVNLRDVLFAQEWVAVEPASWPASGRPAVVEVDGDPAAAFAALGADGVLPELVAVALPEFGAARIGDDGLAAATRAAIGSALELVRAWLATPGAAASRLVVVTRGAADVGGGTVGDAAHAAAAGLVRSAQSEHPDRFVLVDVEEHDGLADVLAELPDGEPQLAVRDGRFHAARLARTAGGGGDVRLDGGTVLLTGGTGGLAAEIAAHLVAACGATHLVLASRRGPRAAGAEELRARLLELGAQRVDLASCDVTRREQVADLLGSIDPAQPLIGVVHLAGVLADATVGGMTAEQIDRVVAPKVDALVHLHELTAGADLRMFATFSSAAAAVGSAGQGNYAAANAFLEAVTAQRGAGGPAGTALAWGMWATEDGMRGQVGDADIARLHRSGFRPITTAEAVTAFSAGISADLPVLLPVPVERAQLRRLAGSGGLPALMRGIAPAGAADGSAASFAERVRGLPGQARLAAVVDVVRTHVARILGHDSGSQVDVGTAFFDMGFDSLSAVELRNELATATGTSLPPTLLFDHPDITSVAEHVLDRLAPEPAPAPAPAEPEPVSAIAEMTADQLVAMALKQGDR